MYCTCMSTHVIHVQDIHIYITYVVNTCITCGLHMYYMCMHYIIPRIMRGGLFVKVYIIFRLSLVTHCKNIII